MRGVTPREFVEKPMVFRQFTAMNILANKSGKNDDAQKDLCEIVNISGESHL